MLHAVLNERVTLKHSLRDAFSGVWGFFPHVIHGVIYTNGLCF